MSKRIIFKNQDCLAIVIPSPSALKNNRTLDDIATKAIKEAGLPVGTKYEIVDTSSIPSDRTFRDAWGKEGAGIKVNIPKARSIHLDNIRMFRNMKLDETDKELILAIEKEESLGELKIKRQSLRDIPQNIDLESASTPEELKAIWPVGLKRSEH